MALQPQNDYSLFSRRVLSYLLKREAHDLPAATSGASPHTISLFLICGQLRLCSTGGYVEGLAPVLHPTSGMGVGTCLALASLDFKSFSGTLSSLP